MEYSYEFDTEIKNSYWADVYEYMQEHNVSKEDAEIEITKLYKQNNWFSSEE